MVYEPRKYRKLMKTPGLVSCEIIERETDLFVVGEVDLGNIATRAAREARRDIEAFIAAHPLFGTTYEPYGVPDSAPEIVKRMALAGQAAGVGPMAAVAGAVAEHVGRACLALSPQVIVENGGDIFIAAPELRRLAIFAGESPLSERIVVVIRPDQTPLGICTSSGTVGHSKSFGRADAAVAVSPNTALADAWATQLGNLVKTQDDFDLAMATAQAAPGLIGAIIIKDDKMAVWGDIELEPVSA
jgi:ApbE superfamily uncharacterized protein (UPF0280 family)